ncbi:MAG: ATP-grasp domain-containing protein [Planctomycetales bacterium]|nr:ATP-grasp domain-containing protein [Planctomycetales bacterium]
MQPGATHPPLLILGVSVRALAESASLAQIPTLGVDLFADRDAQRSAPIAVASTYPNDLFRFAASQPRGPWMYGGSLENFPDEVELLERTHPLAGCSAAAIRRVRSRQLLRQWAASCQLELPPANRLTSHQTWLVKSLHSSGGRGVRWATEQEQARHETFAADTGAESADHSSRLEAWVPGNVGAITFVSGLSTSNSPECTTIGVTWQCPAGRGAAEFAYTGSVGPAQLPKHVQENLEQLGQRITREAALCGLWGLDFILTPAGQPYVLEVNPRWTGSVEVLERVLRRPLLPDHLRGCGFSLGGWERPDVANVPHIHHGKRIVFAERTAEADLELVEWLDELHGSAAWPMRPVADLPSAGQVFAPGDPVCTVFAHGDDCEQVLQRLSQLEAAVHARLAPTSGT